MVGLDFGTTYSGFSYCHISNSKNIVVYDQWPGECGLGQLSTDTVLQYDESNNVKSWGAPALAKRSNHRNRNYLQEFGQVKELDFRNYI